MKKVFIVFCLLCFFMFLSGNTYANRTYVVSSKNVQITDSEYNKLKLFGLNEIEISNIDAERFEEYSSRKVLSQSHTKIYLESEYVSVDGKILYETHRRLDEKSFKNNSKDYKNLKVYNDSTEVDVSPQSITDPEIVIDLGGSGSGSYIIENLHREKEYKIMDATGIYYEDRGNNGEFYLGVDVEWETEPVDRLTDIFHIGFNSDVALKYQVFDGQNYPHINAEFTSQYHIRTYNLGFVDEYDELQYTHYDGRDNSNYTYEVNQNFVTFNYDLPENIFVNNGDYYFNTFYTDMKMSLDLEFSVNNSYFDGITFSVRYFHQYLGINMDWGEISFSSNAPFINYETSIFEVEPEFESVEGYLFFQDLN